MSDPTPWGEFGLAGLVIATLFASLAWILRAGLTKVETISRDHATTIERISTKHDESIRELADRHYNERSEWKRDAAIREERLTNLLSNTRFQCPMSDIVHHHETE